MKKTIKVVSMSLMALFFMATQATAAGNEKSNIKTSGFNWNPVMDAIIQVESEGNPRAVSGNSVGVMQITPILVQDCNNILKQRKSKKRFTLADRYNEAKSKEMFLLIQSHYNPLNSIEKAIRSWNGGVNYSVRATNRYYKKVMRLMK
ncbi:MAG: lytic transglycosylase domain-containing protein [Prevotella sp.]|nr:lytic transglycosylase domain-containing protein [Prevotella sp.]